MKEKIFTLPNLLTLLRIILVPFFLAAILGARFSEALLIFFIAGISDSLDGIIARRFDQKSALGQWLDPAADKLLVASAFIALTIPGRGYEPIPLWLTGAVVLRDVSIVVAALIIKRVTGFKDFKPSNPGKWNTVVLLITVLAFLVTHSLKRYTESLMVFYWISMGMTVFSGLHYIYFIKCELAEYRKRENS